MKEDICRNYHGGNKESEEAPTARRATRSRSPWGCCIKQRAPGSRNSRRAISSSRRASDARLVRVGPLESWFTTPTST